MEGATRHCSKKRQARNELRQRMRGSPHLTTPRRLRRAGPDRRTSLLLEDKNHVGCVGHPRPGFPARRRPERATADKPGSLDLAVAAWP